MRNSVFFSLSFFLFSSSLFFVVVVLYSTGTNLVTICMTVCRWCRNESCVKNHLYVAYHFSESLAELTLDMCKHATLFLRWLVSKWLDSTIVYKLFCMCRDHVQLSQYCHVVEDTLVHFIRPEARLIRVHNNKKTVLVTSKLNYIVNIVIVSRYNSSFLSVSEVVK